MSRLSVAVVKSDFHEAHSTSWGHEWITLCAERGIPHTLVEWRASGAFEVLMRHDLILWHFSHYSADEMRFARPILAALKAAGRRVFPDSGDSEHFDDKVAQAYLLRALNVPLPRNFMLHCPESVEEWIRNDAAFPVVAKLRSGSGSSNVVLLESAGQLRRYASRMFGRGFSARPNAVFKVRSNLASVQSSKDLLRRLKRAPEFFFSWRMASSLNREMGYVYLQEFVRGVDHDLKIVVVGDQLSFICRRVRAGDFRASGGGSLFYDRALITPEVISAAFCAAEKLKSDCTGFDIVVDPGTGRPLILEVSYGFSHTALMQAGGYFDRCGSWHDKPLNAPRALLENLLVRQE